MASVAVPLLVVGVAVGVVELGAVVVPEVGAVACATLRIYIILSRHTHE